MEWEAGSCAISVVREKGRLMMVFGLWAWLWEWESARVVRMERVRESIDIGGEGEARK